MSSPVLLTDEPSTQGNRDPSELLFDGLSDLILTALAKAYGLSPPDLPSLYLTKCRRVSVGTKDGKSFMLFALHVKEAERSKDVAIVKLAFAVDNISLK